LFAISLKNIPLRARIIKGTFKNSHLAHCGRFLKAQKELASIAQNKLKKGRNHEVWNNRGKWSL
jgi:phage terminase large subunit-like protein